MVRLTIRATDESVPATLMRLMEDRIASGVAPPQEKQLPSSKAEIDDAFSNVMV